MTCSALVKCSTILLTIPLMILLGGCKDAFNSPFGIPLTEDAKFNNIKLKITEKNTSESYTDIKIAAYNTAKNKAYLVGKKSFVFTNRQTESDTTYAYYTLNMSTLTRYLETAPTNVCNGGGSSFAFYVTSKNSSGTMQYRVVDIENAQKISSGKTYNCKDKLYYKSFFVKANGKDDVTIYQVFSSAEFKKK